MSASRRPPGKRAAALRYDGRDAPRVVASGRNLVADKILEAAGEAGAPVREDAVLVQALETLELGSAMPPELYAEPWPRRSSGRTG